MIIGVGTDILEIERVRALINGRLGERFLRRILTPRERQLAAERKEQYEFAAGRFAAKEAIVKAFGCGIGEHIGFQDIEIIPDRLGKPCCTLSAEAMHRLKELQYHAEEMTIHLSISHSHTIVSAFAVVERRGQASE